MAVELNPYLNFRDKTREAMTFYKSVFGGKLDMQTFKEFQASDDASEQDKIMHAVLEADHGIKLMAADTPNRMEYVVGTHSFSLSISGEYDDGEVLKGFFEKLTDGGNVTMPMAKAPWGDEFGMVIDKFGTSWLVNIGAKSSPHTAFASQNVRCRVMVANMSTPGKERVYNFSAGPSALPEAVLKTVQEELLNWRNLGLGVMEMSHRSPEFIGIAETAEKDLRELMNIPPNYKVLFLQGGATGQFDAVPMNLSSPDQTADYVVTGMWSKKAFAQAKKHLDGVHAAVKTDPFNYVPPSDEWDLTPGAAYLHVTPNETINGVRINDFPSTDVPLVADISSMILSEPIDVSRFGVIYAGAQKNMGPAGLVVVIIRDDLLDRARPTTPMIWDWKAKAEAGSMLNTPPTLSWYIAGEVFKWLKAQGGVSAIAKVNKRKARKLYAAIDDSAIYSNPVQVESRSIMNVPFILNSPELEAVFLKEAASRGLVNLEGHRSVGGMRASIYNAMPEAGVDALTQFMHDFEAKNA